PTTLPVSVSTLSLHDALPISLRTTFGTLLSKGGVAPRTAQAAMRHSDIRLTMQTYTDPKLLDVSAALKALPALPLGGTHKQAAEDRKSTRLNSSHEWISYAVF